MPGRKNTRCERTTPIARALRPPPLILFLGSPSPLLRAAFARRCSMVDALAYAGVPASWARARRAEVDAALLTASACPFGYGAGLRLREIAFRGAVPVATKDSQAYAISTISSKIGFAAEDTRRISPGEVDAIVVPLHSERFPYGRVFRYGGHIPGARAEVAPRPRTLRTPSRRASPSRTVKPPRCAEPGAKGRRRRLSPVPERVVREERLAGATSHMQVLT